MEGIASDVLRSFVERIGRLEEEKKNLTLDVAQIYQEAKCKGFDVKILRQIVKRHKMAPHERDEQDALISLYEDALIQPQLELVQK